MVSSVNTLGVVFGDVAYKKSENSPEEHLHGSAPSFPTGRSRLSGRIKQCFLRRTSTPGSSLVSWCKSVAPQTKRSPADSKFAWGYWTIELNGSLAQGSYPLSILEPEALREGLMVSVAFCGSRCSVLPFKYKLIYQSIQNAPVHTDRCFISNSCHGLHLKIRSYTGKFPKCLWLGNSVFLFLF